MQANKTATSTQNSKPDKEDLSYQTSLLQKGTQFVKLLRPATIDGGIFQLKSSEIKEAIKRYEKNVDALKPVKFVPASGAATRMFKSVNEWVESPEEHRKAIETFFKRVEEFAFFEDWMKTADKADLETFQSGLESKVNWLKLLLDKKALNLASLPKGLIHFHLYDEPQTPIVEHLKEGMAYAKSDGVVRLHFTISKEHESAIKKEVNAWIKKAPFKDVKWEVNYSYQLPETDTISIGASGEPIQNGSDVLKRPGGHGALIHNLNELEEDLVFIKNIDNVSHDRLLKETVRHKKALAGVLLDLRNDLNSLSGDLGKGLVDEQAINELRDKWKIRIPRDYKKLKRYLKRPTRVCGMVKNQGEPGGGPFWTIDPFTGESLQIIEQAQIDPKDSRQQNIAQGATHFNPVDLVCSIRDLNGQKIDLTEYVNDDQYFTAEKTHDGESIKALEWPGLWNGAMAHWITIFVEVPIQTFNPVKELVDLLRPNHLQETTK